MFQALAEVIRQQLPVFDERRAGRAKYFKKPNKGAVASRDKRTAGAKIRVAEKDAAEAAAEAAAAANTPTTPVVAVKKKERSERTVLVLALLLQMDVDLRSRNNERMIAVKNVFSCPIFARNALRKAVIATARFGRHLKMSAEELEFMESGL